MAAYTMAHSSLSLLDVTSLTTTTHVHMCTANEALMGRGQIDACHNQKWVFIDKIPRHKYYLT